MQAAAAAAALSFPARAQSRRPNIILICADDLGHGDLGCYGSAIPTPNLDQIAEEGIRFTHFCTASPVCSPSRASLLTGRYPVRTGVVRVIGPDEPGGLNLSEVTIANMLRNRGYATSCIGKWHLGATPGYLPTDRGFDEYFGIPYSNDMWPRPLMVNTDIVEQPAKLESLTKRYTQHALDFIRRNTERPFFLYLPHTFPHIPLAASPEFTGKSGQGDYGDAVMEIDWSCGQIISALKDAGLDDNTLVIFMSDNGPWYQGSPGKLRGRKGDTYEGGFRVPFIARMPGAIPAKQVSSEFVSALDVLPTVARVTGTLPPATTIDGIDVWPLLTGHELDRQEVFLYFNDVCLQAARKGEWKLHVARFNVPMFTPTPPEGRFSIRLPNPELYNILSDLTESYDRSTRNVAVVNDIQAGVKRLMATMPADIVQSYQATMGTPPLGTPAGALPEVPPKP